MRSEPALTEPTKYSALATRIAYISWGMVISYDRAETDADGGLMRVHMNENGLGAPCDMLARLGVMRDHRVYHSFPPGWSPLNELWLVRHSAEPTENDLIVGLCHYVLWCEEEAKIGNRHPAFPTAIEAPQQAKRPRAGQPDLGLNPQLIWAVQSGVELLQQFNAGGWDADGNFSACPAFSNIDDYWQSRSEMISRFGSELNIFPRGRP